MLIIGKTSNNILKYVCVLNPVLSMLFSQESMDKYFFFYIMGEEEEKLLNYEADAKPVVIKRKKLMSWLIISSL